MLKKSIFIIWGLLACCGCHSVKYSPADEAKYVKPAVVVMGFEHRAPMNIKKWNLSEGLADHLTDRLMHTNRYMVLDRAKVGRSDRSFFRKEGKTKAGQKSADYMIKCTLTDFGHFEKVPVVFEGLLGKSHYVMVAATIYIVDMQSGQIIASKSVEATVSENPEKEPISYEGMAFGGYTFYHSPLGQATSKMLDKAVYEITRTIEDRPFQPKIASLVNDRVVINAGENRRIKVGAVYVVRPKPDSIVDPDSGDPLGHITGEVLGQVEVIQVSQRYSIAKIVNGYGFEAGQTLFPLEAGTVNRAAVQSRY